MAITRTVDTDDDGTGTTGTIHNNAWLQLIYDAIEAWGLDSYSPAWTAASANPAIGNGTITGKYLEVGDVVWFAARIVAGSTTTFGTGAYSVSTPNSAATAIGLGSVWVQAFDSSAGNAMYAGVATLNTSTTVAPATLAQPAVAWSPTVPITFASGDAIVVMGFYFRA